MNELAFQALTIEEWQRGDYREVALIRLTADELSERYGITFLDDEEAGLGPLKGAGFLTSKEKQFALIYYLWAPAIQMTYIISLYQPNAPDAMTAELEDILEILGLGVADLAWVAESVAFQKHDVWRQDDHGNRYLVTTCPSRADAKREVAKFEAHPHKQTYWVERHRG